MKDLGIRQGSGTQAKPVVYCGDTVYVHTDIRRVEKVGGEAVDDLYSYHEYQYGVEEYIETIGNENASMKQQLEEASSELTSAQLALVGVYEMIGGGDVNEVFKYSLCLRQSYQEGEKDH